MTDDDFWAGHRTDWDEDPRLVGPAISHSSDDFAHHRPSGSIVACYSVRGRWSNAALRRLRDCLDFALPGRYSCRVIDYGNARFTFILGVTGGRYLRNHESEIEATARCAAWAFDYTVLAENGRDPAGAGSVIPLPEPAPQVAQAFRLAQLDLGDGFPRVYDQRTATWGVLRDTAYLDFRHLLYSYYG